MAYDMKLAQRMRSAIGSVESLSEREQFGGLASMVQGNVACGIIGDDLLVRVGPDRHQETMASTAAKPFALTGRPARGWVLVSQSGLASASALKKWVGQGLDFAASLPPK